MSTTPARGPTSKWREQKSNRRKAERDEQQRRKNIDLVFTGDELYSPYESYEQRRSDLKGRHFGVLDLAFRKCGEFPIETLRPLVKRGVGDPLIDRHLSGWIEAQNAVRHFEARVPLLIAPTHQ